MKQIMLVFLLASLVLSACNNDEKLSKEIVGEWHGVSWTDAGKPVTEDPASVTMLLAKDGVYNLVIESRVENGDWHVKHDSLFLIPEKTEDVKMKILSLTSDRLKLQMNRGHIEELELKR